MTQIALIGCAHIHTPGFMKTVLARDDVKVKSVWDHHPARGQQRANELQARFVGDLKDILDDPAIGAAVICSETDRHLDLVLPAAAAGKHLFVEKPLGFGGKDGYAMADAIEKAGVIFQTGYAMRGGAIVNFLRDQVARGTFGRITRVRGCNCHGGALGGWFDSNLANPADDWRWMADPKIAGVGAFGDLGTHLLDLLLWMFGDITQTTALLDNGTARYPDCDETGEALFRFKSGAIGTLAAAWDDLANPVPLLISGTEGHATIVDWKLYIHTKHLPGADGKQPWTDLPPDKPAGFTAFLDAITGKPADLVSAREAAYRSAVMEAMYRGAKQKIWVDVVGQIRAHDSRIM